MIHLLNYSTNGYYGTSTIEYGSRSLGIALASDKNAKGFFWCWVYSNHQIVICSKASLVIAFFFCCPIENTIYIFFTIIIRCAKLREIITKSSIWK